MKLRKIKQLLILTILITEGFAKRNFLIKIKEVTCRNMSPVMNHTCTMTKSSRVAGFTTAFKVTEDVDNLRYDVAVSYLKKTGKWESFFKFNNIDVCEFLAAKFTVPIFLIARNLMRKFSNYPDECPLKKDTLYFIQRMKFDPEQFPPYLPEGEYKATGLIYNKKQGNLTDFQLVFLIVPKAIKADTYSS